MDISILLAWHNGARKEQGGGSSLIFRFDTQGRTNWRNLKVWLDHIFQRGRRGFDFNRPLSLLDASTFETSVMSVQALVLALHGQRRKVEEAQLGHIRELLGLFDPGWMQEL